MTGKPVHSSNAHLDYESAVSRGLHISASLVAPPQIHPDRACDLATMYLLAFFYLLTYDEGSRKGHFNLGNGVAVNLAMRADWGNAAQVSFGSLAREWDLRLVAIAAEGHFCVAIRKQPDALCWSWALEWNQNCRLIGFVADPHTCAVLVDKIEVEPMYELPGGSSAKVLRVRKETPLDPSKDVLFDIQSGAAT